MNAWEWFSATASVDQMLQLLGLGTLAFLFARDLILTKGQHLRRVQDIVDAYNLRIADLIAHQDRERTEWQVRIDEVRESRDAYKQAEHVQRERADSVTAGLADIASTQTSILHVLTSLDRALAVGGNDDRP